MRRPWFWWMPGLSEPNGPIVSLEELAERQQRRDERRRRLDEARWSAALPLYREASS